jgi:hypothetical protein
MFLSRRAKNKRFKREHVLDVKLRSSQVRSARARRIGVAAQWLILLVVAGLAIWQATEWGVNHFIFENEFFAVRVLEVQTDGAIEVEQLKRWANIRRGENLLGLDLARVKRDLELCPWIRTATVERWLPGTVRIRVAERKPLAQIRAFHHRADGGGYEQINFHLDETGFVMLPVGESEPGRRLAVAGAELPIIAGLPESVLRVGKQAEAPQLQAALKLIQIFQDSAMAAETELRQIDLSRPQVLQAITSTGSEITFALDQMDRQIQRWRAIQEFGARSGKAIQTLDLSISNHLPARWIEANSLPPGLSRPPPKTAAPRKKYV